MTRFFRSKGFIATIGVALALAVGALAIQNDPAGRWRSVERRDLVIGVPFEGELRAVQSASLGPPSLQSMWNFKIAFLAPEGKPVRKGQPVIRFDSTELEQRLRQAAGERDSAAKELEKLLTDLEIERRQLELELSEAEADLRRATLATEVPEELTADDELQIAVIERRAAERVIEHMKSKMEFEKKRSEFRVRTLEERRRRAEAEVRELEEAIAAMTVHAGRDGTVILNTSRQREKVKVGDQVWRGRRVLEIPDLSAMLIDAQIAEADAGRLETGQPVTFRLDAHPDREYSGRVESVRRAVQPKSSNDPEKVVRAVITVDETDTERMRPGMRLRGAVEIERLPDAVVVPQEAIFTDADGPWVWSRGTLGPSRVEPELGPRNDRYFQVLSGLAPGDAVLVRDPETAP